MKKVKFYTAVCLIVVMIAASCSGVLASGVISDGLTWLFSPVEGVRGYVYASSPHGFIIKDYENDTTALVNHNGAVIPNSSKNFTCVREDGLIEFYDYNEGSGVMDVNGNIVIAAGAYYDVTVLSENRFAYGNMDERGYFIYGVMDRNHNVIIPPVYDYIRANGLIYCSNDDGQYIYDYDGNLIVQYPYNENEYISLLSANDRYLFQRYDPSTETTTTKIMHINGGVIAEMDGWIYELSETVLYTVKYFDNDYEYHYYDYDCNFIGSESGKDVWEAGSMYEAFTNGGDISKYSVEYINNREVVVDQSGNIVFDNPDNLSFWEIVDDKFIIVYRDGYQGIYAVDGSPVILPNYYDEISYCEELGLFAFEKDFQVSLAKNTPATPVISVDVYGVPVEFDQPPVLKDGRTLVPVRAISEALGALVDWDEPTQTVTATLGDTVVKLVINSNQILVNGEVVEIDVPAEIINSRTLIPVRALSEAFGCNVQWDGDNYHITIN